MPDTTPTLYTIGYQGKTIEEFLAVLLGAGIELVVDVRRRPISRKPGFAKAKLSSALADAGIDYRHIVDLGMPEDLLQEKNARDNSRILDAYDQHLAAHPELVEEVAALASSKPACLLCFEADITQCHRSRLASAVRRIELRQIVHL